MTDRPGARPRRRSQAAVLLTGLVVAGAAAVAAVLAEPVAVGLAAFTSVLAVVFAGLQLLRRPVSRPPRVAGTVEVSIVVPAPRGADQTVEVQLRAEPPPPTHSGQP